MNFVQIKHYFSNDFGVWETSKILVMLASCLPNLVLAFKILTRTNTHTLFNIRNSWTIKFSTQTAALSNKHKMICSICCSSFAILFAITGCFGPSLAYFHFQVFSDKDESDPDQWRTDCSRLLEFRYEALTTKILPRRQKNLTLIIALTGKYLNQSYSCRNWANNF